MLRCWSCAHRFQQKLVLRDSYIKGRVEEQGGPYRLYTCPGCHKSSIVEATPAGRYFASPYKDISLIEFLFGWIQSITPRDYLKILEWQRNFEERRRHFFERDGDSRYSHGTLRSWLEKILPLGDDRPRSTQVVDDERGRDANERESAEDRAGAGSSNYEPPAASIPHPYRVLGVQPDATDLEVRTAFKKLARRWHPDKVRTRNPQVLEEASRRLAELIEAYETLTSDRENSDDNSDPS